MSRGLTEFSAMLQKAGRYRMSGQKLVKARRKNVIVKTEWHKQYLSGPFTYACMDTEVRKNLSGTGWGTYKAWVKFGHISCQNRWSSLSVGSYTHQCLPWCTRLQAALFYTFLASARSILMMEQVGYPYILPLPLLFLEGIWPLGFIVLY